MDHVHPTPINKRSVSMQIWVTTMQNAIRFDGNKLKYGSRRWFYGSLRCKKRSVSMEISTDSDPNYSKGWFYGSLRCKKRSVSMEISTDSDPNYSKGWFYGSLRCKKRSVSMETSRNMDPEDGFIIILVLRFN
eukprot:212272_1